MSPDDLRRFARRRWDIIAAAKLQFVAERFRAQGSTGARAAARRLAERWARLHPHGPTPESRRSDLSHHVALKAKLDRTGHAVARR